MAKIKYYFVIMRRINFIITFLSIFVAGIICNVGNIEILEIILASIAGAFVGAAGNIINDIFDIATDKINRPERPLPANKISRKEAMIMFYSLNISALLISLQINFISFFIVVFSEVSIFFYSFSLKRIPLLGNFTVSFFTGLAFVFGGAAVDNISNSYIPALFAFFINFIREIVKDIQDIEGDSRQNIITFPSKFGVKNAVKFIIYLTMILIIMTLMPVVYDIYRMEYYFSVLPVDLLLIYFSIKISADHSRTNIGRMSGLLKISMGLGLVAIYLGNKGFSF